VADRRFKTKKIF